MLYEFELYERRSSSCSYPSDKKPPDMLKQARGRCGLVPDFILVAADEARVGVSKSIVQAKMFDSNR